MCKKIKIIFFVFCLLFISNIAAAENLTGDDIKNRALFDIFLSIPQDYQSIPPGDELLTSIKLINLGSAGRIDVVLHFRIEDSSKNIIEEKQETVAVETQANFVRTFQMPDEIKPGKYTLFVKMIYADGRVALAQSDFTITQNLANQNYLFYGILVIILLLVIGAISYVIPLLNRFVEYQSMKRNIRKMIHKKLGS